MNTMGNPRLRDMLAAEYALGTLRGGARRRFERWTREDAELRALTIAWGERLAPLIDSIPSAAPRARVWTAIEARLPGFTARHARDDRLAAPSGWWDRVVLWRGLSAALATVAVIAIGIAVRPAPVVAPQIVRVPTLPSAIATLVDPKGGAPVAMVMASSDSDAIEVKVAADVEVPDGRALQLWTARTDREGFQSMGMLPATARSAAARAEPPSAVALTKVKAFGLSLEPVGGSPAPTHVLGLGALVRLAS